MKRISKLMIAVLLASPLSAMAGNVKKLVCVDGDKKIEVLFSSNSSRTSIYRITDTKLAVELERGTFDHTVIELEGDPILDLRAVIATNKKTEQGVAVGLTEAQTKPGVHKIKGDIVLKQFPNDKADCELTVQ